MPKLSKLNSRLVGKVYIEFNKYYEAR